MPRLALLFLLVPVLELILLFRMGQWVGILPTVSIVLVTGLFGAFLVRREGLRAMLAVQGELARGRLPTRPLMDGVAVLVGGAFLMTPGILTDLAGFLLLLPPTRRILHRWAQARLAQAVARGTVHVAAWGMGEDARTGSRVSAPKDEGSSSAQAGSPLGSSRSGDAFRDRNRASRPSRAERPPRPGEIVQD